MAGLERLSPNGWFNGWISQGQIYPGYLGNPDNNLLKTVNAFSNVESSQSGIDPANQLMLDALMTYYGSGSVTDNRYDVLKKSQLVGTATQGQISAGKTPWNISKDAGQTFKPLLTVYLNDASTSESTFNLLTDISSLGGTLNGKSIPVNVLANAALQVGAFLGARIWSANPGAGLNDPATNDLSAADIRNLRLLKNSNFITGDILLTPDGFGSFIKNLNSSNYVNAGTSSVGSFDARYYQQTLEKLPAPGGGWKIVPQKDAPAGTLSRIIPESVTIGGEVYTVQSELIDPGNGNYVPRLLGPDGKTNYSDHNTDSKLNLSINAKIDARGALAAALRYLKELRPTYEKYGVVFPEIFYGTDSEFDSFVRSLPGFSPAPGTIVPGLDASADGDISDLLAVQTYLVKLFAGPLNVAHVLNPWAVGAINSSSLPKPFGNGEKALDGTMLQDTGPLLSGLGTAKEVRDRLNSVAEAVKEKAEALGWFKASPYMDYLAIDKYERDEISGTVNNLARGQFNAYNRNGWINYAYYANALSRQLRTGSESGDSSGRSTGAGDVDLLYYQIPASSLPSDLKTGSTDPFIKGLYGVDGAGSASLGDQMNVAIGSPHLSFAVDSFWGNPDLASRSLFESKYPELKDLSVQLRQAAGVSAKTLGDFLFDTSANALEDRGAPRDLTKGVFSVENGVAKANKDLFGDLFGIVWGGGNSSTPLSYSLSQWGDYDNQALGDTLTTRYTPNGLGLMPLGNTVDNLVDWAAANFDGPTGGAEVNVRSLGLKYAALKTDSIGKLSLAVASQAANSNSLYIYKLSASSDIDAITGLTAKGNAPTSASAFYQDIISNGVLVASGLNTSSAGQGAGKLISNLSVDPSSYYGVLLVSKPSDSQPYYSTSYSAAGSWDGKASSYQGLSAAALVDSTEINSKFFAGKSTFADSRVIGFEDNILAGKTDFDYNDVFLAVTNGGSILV